MFTNKSPRTIELAFKKFYAKIALGVWRYPIMIFEICKAFMNHRLAIVGKSKTSLSQVRGKILLAFNNKNQRA